MSKRIIYYALADPSRPISDAVVLEQGVLTREEAEQNAFSLRVQTNVRFPCAVQALDFYPPSPFPSFWVRCVRHLAIEAPALGHPQQDPRVDLVTEPGHSHPLAIGLSSDHWFLGQFLDVLIAGSSSSDLSAVEWKKHRNRHFPRLYTDQIRAIGYHSETKLQVQLCARLWSGAPGAEVWLWVHAMQPTGSKVGAIDVKEIRVRPRGTHVLQSLLGWPGFYDAQRNELQIWSDEFMDGDSGGVVVKFFVSAPSPGEDWRRDIRLYPKPLRPAYPGGLSPHETGSVLPMRPIDPPDFGPLTERPRPFCRNQKFLSTRMTGAPRLDPEYCADVYQLLSGDAQGFENALLVAASELERPGQNDYWDPVKGAFIEWRYDGQVSSDRYEGRTVNEALTVSPRPTPDFDSLTKAYELRPESRRKHLDTEGRGLPYNGMDFEHIQTMPEHSPAIRHWVPWWRDLILKKAWAAETINWHHVPCHAERTLASGLCLYLAASKLDGERARFWYEKAANLWNQTATYCGMRWVAGLWEPMTVDGVHRSVLLGFNSGRGPSGCATWMGSLAIQQLVHLAREEQHWTRAGWPSLFSLGRLREIIVDTFRFYRDKCTVSESGMYSKVSPYVPFGPQEDKLQWNSTIGHLCYAIGEVMYWFPEFIPKDLIPWLKMAGAASYQGMLRDARPVGTGLYKVHAGAMSYCLGEDHGDLSQSEVRPG